MKIKKSSNKFHKPESLSIILSMAMVSLQLFAPKECDPLSTETKRNHFCDFPRAAMAMFQGENNFINIFLMVIFIYMMIKIESKSVIREPFDEFFNIPFPLNF